jgi:adenylate cyclase class IV
MKEVEVKIRIADPDKIAQILKAQGCILGEPVIQHDMVYIPNEVPTVPVPAGVNVLRIREQDERAIFTLKQSDFGNNLSKLEHELEIGNKNWATFWKLKK